MNGYTYNKDVQQSRRVGGGFDHLPLQIYRFYRMPNEQK